MPESDRRQGADDEWRDIHLDDIIRGVGSFISLVSSVVESMNTPATSTHQPSAAGQSRLSAGSAVAGVRDPVVDLFDEGDEIVLVIEWPYVEDDQLLVEVRDDVLTLSFGGEWPYSTDLLLPAVVDPASLRRRWRNGITEVRLRRAA